MIIFIKNIPNDTLLLELYSFVAPVLKSVVMECFEEITRVEILKVEILKFRNQQTKVVEYHGLVHVDSELAGKAAVLKLDGKRFKNKPISVSEFSPENFDYHASGSST